MANHQKRHGLARLFLWLPYVTAAQALLFLATAIWLLTQSETTTDQVFALFVLMLSLGLGYATSWAIWLQRRLSGRSQPATFPTVMRGVTAAFFVEASFGLGFLTLGLVNLTYGHDAALTVILCVVATMFLLLAAHSAVWRQRVLRRFGGSQDEL